MARSRYRMSPKRRAALRKAQLASARKRKGRGLSGRQKAGIGVAGILAAGVAYHKISKSQLSIRVGKNDNSKRAKPMPSNGISVRTNNLGVTKAQARGGRSTKKANRMSGHRDVQVRASVANRFLSISWKHKGGHRKVSAGPAPQMRHFSAKTKGTGRDTSHIPISGARNGVLIYHGAGTRLI